METVFGAVDRSDCVCRDHWICGCCRDPRGLFDKGNSSMNHMNHIENPVIWKLFFLVCGLSSVAIVMAALGREAIWKPRDAFDRAFCNAFRILGASAVIAILCFSYGVTARCVAVENECQVCKELALRGDANASGIAFENQGIASTASDYEYTATTSTGRTVSVRSAPSGSMSGGSRSDWGPAGRDGGVFGFVGAEIPRRGRSAPVLPNSESGVRASVVRASVKF